MEKDGHCGKALLQAICLLTAIFAYDKMKRVSRGYEEVCDFKYVACKSNVIRQYKQVSEKSVRAC